MKKTDIVCWWDTCSFDNIPCFIPEKYYDNTFYVFGCFCSFNCALAYNLNISDHKYKVFDRHSLIQKFYSVMTGKNNIISIAPPREILKKYGGNTEIKDYRKLFNLINKKYKLKLPPIINLIPCIEEKTKTKVHESINNTPSVKKFNIQKNNIIPVKKKLIHNIKKRNIIDNIGMIEKHKKTDFFFE